MLNIDIQRDTMLLKKTVQASYILTCGTATISNFITRTLREYNCEVASGATVLVIVDAPNGYALQTLASHTTLGIVTIIVTDNTCPEYLDDLWDLHPTDVLIGIYNVQQLAHVLTTGTKVEPYHNRREHAPLLTSNERAVLRYVAHGWANKQIAESLCLQEKTIRNVLTSVYMKLHLPNRVAASLYYWDCCTKAVWSQSAAGSTGTQG